ncbi:hypothetical protein NVV93_05075 [Pseudomonas sp. LS44]|nr:hypothetical protein [Pseudomonas sp. LS44]UVE18765.1 hypothetical protein NVV93_05075 [Pseudomonas sp. LS44]
MDSPRPITREMLEQALQHSPFAQLIGFQLTGFEAGRICLEVLPAAS